MENDLRLFLLFDKVYFRSYERDEDNQSVLDAQHVDRFNSQLRGIDNQVSLCFIIMPKIFWYPLLRPSFLTREFHFERHRSDFAKAFFKNSGKGFLRFSNFGEPLTLKPYSNKGWIKNCCLHFGKKTRVAFVPGSPRIRLQSSGFYKIRKFFPWFLSVSRLSML